MGYSRSPPSKARRQMMPPTRKTRRRWKALQTLQPRSARAADAVFTGTSQARNPWRRPRWKRLTYRDEQPPVRRRVGLQRQAWRPVADL